mmetsp:Transcript_14142/g.30926  ORF Transcript_14142/g.30926 Transcript_14142/m.30926 type:complete len:201 (-) Transcript_14142:55-657(-)
MSPSRGTISASSSASSSSLCLRRRPEMAAARSAERVPSRTMVTEAAPFSITSPPCITRVKPPADASPSEPSAKDPQPSRENFWPEPSNSSMERMNSSWVFKRKEEKSSKISTDECDSRNGEEFFLRRCAREICGTKAIVVPADGLVAKAGPWLPVEEEDTTKDTPNSEEEQKKEGDTKKAVATTAVEKISGALDMIVNWE